MPPRRGFTWHINTLTPTLAAFSAGVNFGIGATLEHVAEDIEEWMKENAPWDDRSGAAREGLGADYRPQGFLHEIVMYHTEDYGIWLEVRWSGRYAIIVPALEHWGPIAMGELSFASVGGD